MQTQPFSTEHLDYLQRIGIVPGDISRAHPVVSVPIEQRRLLRIDGVGRLEKALVPEVEQGKQPVRQQSEDILIGLYGYRIPVVFYVRGDPAGVAIHIGSWESTAQGQSPLVTLDSGQNVLRGVLHGLYPAIELAPVAVQMSIWPKSGFVLGIPTVKPPDPSDGALPLDRLIRALAGTQWAYLVLAEPVPDHITSKLQQNIIYETRTVQAATKGAGVPNPLAEYYTELLKTGLTTLTQGQGVGTWRTGVYLLGEHDSYYRLASVWRSIFSGEKSLPEPIRIWDNVSTGALSVNWAMPNMLEQEGPGQYRHPFQFQTLLNSSQLAAYVHLPRLETSGFAIQAIPDFDVVPQQRKGNESTFSLGNVYDRMLVTQKPYEVNAKALTRHVFVAGVTGAGKTNTVFHLLKQAWAMKVPFLVIEPVKTEYRALLNDVSIANDVRVFTLGDENISPFRLNPFEVLSGTPISVHLDLLRSAFNASFGMWSPLPQVLEQCLHRIYEDRGWDIARSTNYRLDAHADAADAFPTLSNLVAKVDEVTRELGYEDKITADIRAALHTRLNALRAGGKGFMLDVQRSLPMKELLEHPTILELERMGDDDDRAFMMGLLLIRLAEYRRAFGQANGLIHLLVIEEAHRLLTNVGQRQSEEEANPRGKAVEAFANLLSEIRAYGQGVIVADQVPVKLAPDVIKNTNLKIVHRIVAEDDRTVLAGSMVMNERQKKSLATLIPGKGQAVVFSEGDDAAMLVQVPPIKDDAKPWPERKRIIQHMASTKALQGYQGLFLPFPTCASTCLIKGQACQAAQQIVEDAAFQGTFARTVLSTIEDTGALDRMWGDLLSVIQAKRSPKSDEQSLLRCTMIRASYWFAGRRGTQVGWSYAQTKIFAEKLHQMLLAKLTAAANPEPTRSGFQQYARTLHARLYPPFPACELICQQDPPVCLYRYAAADLITVGRHSANWRAADANDNTSQDNRRRQSWEAAQNAGYDLIEFPEADWPNESLKQRVQDAARRSCLCFAQQMLAADVSKIPRTNRIILVKLQKEAI